MTHRRKPDDEHDEFARAMADVVRLAADPRGRVPKVRRVVVPAVTDDTAAVAADAEVPDSYTAPGVDRRELRRLKRGDYVPRQRLDLHGATAVEARAAVTRLLQNSSHAGHRCVCIVHGRGVNSPGGVAVLREQVRAQLTRTRAVLAFAPAPPADGGNGAVYVLLRKSQGV